MIYPPVYPWSAFDDRRFLSKRRATLIHERDGAGTISVHTNSSFLRGRLTADYNQVHHEVAGVLKGEYGVFGNGMMLFDRDGTCLSINFPCDSTHIVRMLFDQANNEHLKANRDEVYRDWDSVPIIDNVSIFSHIYHGNYYHFSYELAQKFRILNDFDVETVLLPDELLDAPFKQDLIGRAVGSRQLLSLKHAVRVRDPVVIQTYQSPASISWLRGFYPRNAEPDGRKYYVRRTPSVARRGNNIAESDAFLNLLEAHDFIPVDFGNGEHSLPDQIAMLDGASVILTAHGAGLTNLTYLRAPLRVIEVFSPAVLSTSFMRISTALGFDHHAILSEEVDEAGDIVVDCDQLEAVLRA